MHSLLKTCTTSLHSVAGDTHHSASPMGLWLLLAVVSSVTPPESLDRSRVEKVLGMPSEQALCVVEELLGQNLEETKNAITETNSATEALNAAMALWLRENSLTGLKEWASSLGLSIDDTPQEADIYAWRDSLPDIIESGDIPTNEEANRWVSDKTGGLINKLPIPIEESTYLILLSAIATHTKWRAPFREVPNNDILNGDFKDASKVLISDSSHQVYIEDTEFGMVGVHVAHGTNGLDVYSVIADPKVDYLDVLQVAHEIAEEDRDGNQGVPLHQLEVDASGLYTVEHIKSAYGDQRVAYLPSWKTETSLKNLQRRPELGFTPVMNAISKASGIDPEGVNITETDIVVQQDIVAEYTASGFDAAAVTQMSMRIGAVSVPVLNDALKLSIPFDHPYAVVAVVRDNSAWTGTPIFSSWVKEVG